MDFSQYQSRIIGTLEVRTNRPDAPVYCWNPRTRESYTAATVHKHRQFGKAMIIPGYVAFTLSNNYFINIDDAEVSLDDGKTWTPAECLNLDEFKVIEVTATE